jgi:hypothetical protein
LAVAIGAVLCSASSFAGTIGSPVVYDFDQGFVTLTVSVEGTPISTPVTANLVGTQVTIDETASDLASIELVAKGPITITLDKPWEGFSKLVIEILSLSGESGSLTKVDEGVSTTEYFFLVDPMTTEALISADGDPPLKSIPFLGQAPASGSLFVSSKLNQLSLSGITLVGLLPLESKGPVLGLKADFVFSGTPVPEPSTAMLFAAGLVAIAVRGRNSKA